MSAWVIAMANRKGGVAKTTTSVSLGGALVQNGYDVLLVDLDPQANLTLALGLDPAKARGTAAEVLLNSASLNSVSQSTSIPGIDIVSSNAQMEMVERFLPVRQNFEQILRSALSGSNPYDFIILDCPPAVGAITLNALVAANLLVIPTLPEYFSAHALRAMLAHVRQVRRSLNPGLVYRILITMRDRRNRIHRQLFEQIQATFGEGLFKTAIEIDTKLRESAVAGLPVGHYLPNSRSAGQYAALAQEIIEYVQEKTAQQA